MPFNWLFALLVGAVILFLAFMFVNSYVNLQRFKYDSETAARLAILLNPLQTSLGDIMPEPIKFQTMTRFQLNCSYKGLGTEQLSISTSSNIGQKWQEYGTATAINNKYIFSQGIEEGKTLYLFAKQMKMPFYVSDLIFATTKSYCFINPPERTESEIRALNASNIVAVQRKQECGKDAVTVCFGSSYCNVNVHPQCLGYGCEDQYSYGLVEHPLSDTKNTIIYYYGDALMYGAIFSSPDIYNCNIQRILKRIDMLSQLYFEKAYLLDARGCSTGKLKSKLADLSTLSLSLIKTADILGLVDKVKEVESANEELAACRPFST